MKQIIAAGRLSTAKWALLMSVFGFTYALLTSIPHSASATATGVVPRVLATNCSRLPTEFATLPDLGAVVVGSQFTRQILVRFGFGPHSFKVGNFGAFSGKLGISPPGRADGTVTSAGINIFEAVVSDGGAGVPQPPTSALFFVNAVDQQFSEAPLHFETGQPVAVGTNKQEIALPNAVAGEAYICTISPNGGVLPYTMQVLENPVGGRFVPQGMAFDATNFLIYGKPVAPTPTGSPAKITLLLIDAAGSQVTGTFDLNILPGTISSQAVATSGNISLNFGNDNLFDSLQLSMIIDKSDLNAAGIRTVADLKDRPITLNFGGFQLPPNAQPGSQTKIINTFDAKGQINVPPHLLSLGDVVGSRVKDVIYTIKFDPRSGILTVKFKNLNMIQAIGANYLSFEGQSDPINRGPVVPINIKIGAPATAGQTTQSAVFEKTDNIKFVYKRQGSIAHGTAKFNDNLAPAGIFLVNKVSGTEQQTVVDSVNNVKADRIFLQMRGLMRSPGAKAVVPKTGDTVSVIVNRLCLGTFPASSFAVQGSQLVFSNNDPTKGLNTLIIDNKKGTVLITTNGLDPSNNLFGVDILNAGQPETIPITLTISGTDPHNPTFDGQSTVTLFRKGKSIVNR